MKLNIFSREPFRILTIVQVPPPFLNTSRPLLGPLFFESSRLSCEAHQKTLSCYQLIHQVWIKLRDRFRAIPVD